MEEPAVLKPQKLWTGKQVGQQWRLSCPYCACVGSSVDAVMRLAEAVDRQAGGNNGNDRFGFHLVVPLLSPLLCGCGKECGWRMEELAVTKLAEAVGRQAGASSAHVLKMHDMHCHCVSIGQSVQAAAATSAERPPTSATCLAPSAPLLHCTGVHRSADALYTRPAALHHVCRLQGAQRHLGQEQRCACLGTCFGWLVRVACLGARLDIGAQRHPGATTTCEEQPILRLGVLRRFASSVDCTRLDFLGVQHCRWAGEKLQVLDSPLSCPQARATCTSGATAWWLAAWTRPASASTACCTYST